ncbi:hypothetical protein HZF08_03335 [Paenibacillus sp. CGMCC 1.16610]|uniref:Uncharacterized protein n=1 Tax=Paenibacillus anseongense TaxID=2682845 RepID=A0ABW9U8G8_9BACL|nr:MULTISPECIES: hypothetical protein [Paenibacillus]MBA2937326.1 hypothetical protein [Paenibacillus sp. CGMCC 1.16610]MVQ36384.1 hypothetical protein [Paenibacillus anseongense]
MSEFTAGSLIRNSYRETVQQHNPLIVKELNEQWTVFITSGTGVSEMAPSDVMAISQHLPVLYFYNFEDHGWGFTLLHQGEAVSTFDLSYEQEEVDLMNYVKDKFPDQDAVELLYISPDSDTFRASMVLEMELQQSGIDRVHMMLRQLDVEAFKLFELGAAEMEQLRHLFEAETIAQLERKHAMVDDFKTILGIEEMSWVRADRLEWFES